MKWSIENLRGVGQVELTLNDDQRVFVFLGSNGIGKTKTLEALAFFLLAKTEGFADSGHTIQDQNKNFVKIALEKNTSVESLNCQSALFGNNQIYIPKLLQQITITEYIAFAFLGATQRSNTHKSNNSNNFIGDFEQRKKAFFDLITQAIVNNQLKDFGMNQNIHQWFVERAQSVNPYQKSADNRKIDIDTVLKALNSLDSRVEQKLDIDGSGRVFLTIEGKQRELNELSSGFISILKIIQTIIAAYAAFTNEQNLLHVKGVVLIDEIESHLHVGWQTKIIPTLKQLFPNTTFYITTHSPLVLSQLEQGEAYLLHRNPQGVVKSQVIDSPNKRILTDVVNDAFNIDLNQLKLESLQHSDQQQAKSKLLQLLNNDGDLSL